MELVEGERSRRSASRAGAIPLDEALPIAQADRGGARSGARARDHPSRSEAREHQGAADGTVKVLDFGLAKAMDPRRRSSPDVSQSPTITTPAMTQAGMILGTAAYMSPEQAKGRPADKRSDMWAFGCVLYEMLTGQAAFEGEDVSDTLAAVLKQRAGLDALPADVPTHVRMLVQRCLEKDRKQRIADVQRRTLVIDRARHGAASAGHGRRRVAARRARCGGARCRSSSRPSSCARSRPAPCGVSVPRSPAPVTRFAIALPDGQQFTVERRPKHGRGVARRHAHRVHRQSAAVPSVAVRSRSEAHYRRRQRGDMPVEPGVFARWPIDRVLRTRRSNDQENCRSPAEPP